MMIGGQIDGEGTGVNFCLRFFFLVSLSLSLPFITFASPFPVFAERSLNSLAECAADYDVMR